MEQAHRQSVGMLYGDHAQMSQLLANPIVNLIVWATLLGGALLGALYVLSKVRGGIKTTAPDASQWMSNFREMHSQGELSDEEYRTIKAMLADKLHSELNSAHKPE